MSKVFTDFNQIVRRSLGVFILLEWDRKKGEVNFEKRLEKSLITFLPNS